MSVDAAAKYLKQSSGWAYNILNTYEEFGHADFSDERGPKRVTTETQDREIVKLATAVKPLTTQQIADKLTAKGIPVSRVLITRRLRENKVRWKPLLKKPLLKESHIENRYRWAEANVDRDWTKVIFTDEASFKLNCQVTHA